MSWLPKSLLTGQNSLAKKSKFCPCEIEAGWSNHQRRDLSVNRSVVTFFVDIVYLYSVYGVYLITFSRHMRKCVMLAHDSYFFRALYRQAYLHVTPIRSSLFLLML